MAPIAPALQLIGKRKRPRKTQALPEKRKRLCSMRNLRLRTTEAYELCASWIDGAGLATATGPDVPVACRGFVSGLRISMPPLKNAPSSMLMRAAATSPCSDPSARMSTRSVAETLPFTLPSTTTSRAVMLAPTCPLRPMVRRLPGKLIAPSTLPSIYKDSEPVISPLMNRLLPSVACSVFPACIRDGVSGTCAGGAACCGSGVGFGIDDPVWLGFHIALKVFFLFCPLQDWGCQGTANGPNP